MNCGSVREDSSQGKIPDFQLCISSESLQQPNINAVLSSHLAIPTRMSRYCAFLKNFESLVWTKKEFRTLVAIQPFIHIMLISPAADEN